MAGNNFRLWLGVVAALLAAVVALALGQVQAGAGIIVGSLATGAGWLFKDLIEEDRSLRKLCQAYAAFIELQHEEVQATFSDTELQRFLDLAPAIAAGTEAPAVGKRVADPYAILPELRDHLHLLSTDTVRYLFKWRARGMDLLSAYDEMGTVEQAKCGAARLAAQFAWLKTYRDEYRDIAYTALHALQSDSPALRIDVALFKAHGARRLDQTG